MALAFEQFWQAREDTAPVEPAVEDSGDCITGIAVASGQNEKRNYDDSGEEHDLATMPRNFRAGGT